MPSFSTGQNSGPHHPHNPSEKAIKLWKEHGKPATVDMLSALYGIILVVMGVAFPTSQVISIKIPSHYYEGFYAYLYFVSIGFFGYIYVLLQTQFNSFTWKKSWHQLALRHKTPETKAEDDCAFEENRVLSMEDIMTNQLRVTAANNSIPDEIQITDPFTSAWEPSGYRSSRL
ncbi:uncharacterized protein LOC124199245 isoform X2 [Daphnia pulex]|uniref:uncharacterized protein LOC124199245 isoform X2 n=1 Tax=Daphnia pulex TaxID=6669 RepID=UPI001EDFC434|nr:uncharacterized protein LOC124199245 isoform X2 [Daphnia pulex]